MKKWGEGGNKRREGNRSKLGGFLEKLAVMVI